MSWGISNEVFQKKKSHISLPIFFHCFFLFVFERIKLSFFLFQSHISHGIPRVSSLNSLKRGEKLALLKKIIIKINNEMNRKLFQWMGGEKKKTGTWWHAPCCSFNLVWRIYCYFISTRKKNIFYRVRLNFVWWWLWTFTFEKQNGKKNQKEFMK